MPTYTIQGKGKISLNDTTDFIAEGGEGKVYGKGNVIYKIYLDQSKMVSLAKIQELSHLDSPNILIPKDLILDNKNTVIGFTMDRVQDTVPFSRLFTNAFRDKNITSPELATMKLVEETQNKICFIHDKKCLVVDMNEFNILGGGNDFTTPYFIDTNSYQTPSFPATAIMPTIRDWHAKSFSTLTDWFSFAIIAFQLFVGIHPYKGDHPNYTSKQLIDRMKANVSIFDPNVSISKNVRDFSYIPTEYMEWFKKLFQKGDRIPPPKVAGLLNLVQVVTKVINATNFFIIDFIKKYDSDIVKCNYTFGHRVLSTKTRLYVDDKEYKVSKPASVDIIFIPSSLEYVLVKIENNKLVVGDKNGTLIPIPEIKCKEKFVINNSLFVRNEGKLIEIEIDEFSGKKIVSIKNSWEIMPQSSEMFDGVIYQNILGKAYLTIPVPNQGKDTKCYEIKVPELDKYKIIDAKHENGVCILLAHNGSLYHKFILKFDDYYSKYSTSMIDDIGVMDINFITMENGVCVSINNDGSMELFQRKMSSTSSNQIKDPDIDSSMRLTRNGTTIMFYKKNELFSITMKNKK